MENEITTYHEFNAYYEAGKALVRAKSNDFHIFRFSELGQQLADHMGPFKTGYYQFAIGNRLSADVSVFDRSIISENFSLVIFVPGQIIEWTKTGEWDGYVINVKEEFLDLSFTNKLKEDFQFLFSLKPLIVDIGSEKYKEISYLYELIYREHSIFGEENKYVIKSLLHVLIIFIKRAIEQETLYTPSLNLDSSFSSFNYVDVAARFKSMVVKTYLKSKSVSYYCEKLNVTEAFLNKSIKTIFGKTAKEIINEVLLMHSKTMLKNPEVGIKEIAYQLNYTDYSHFVKFFKANLGLTPAQYRQEMI